MKIEYSARSHVGKVRENNEDNLFVDGMTLPADIGSRPFAIDGFAENSAVFAVCDGMGGKVDGEVASRLAVEGLFSYSKQIQDAKPRELGKVVQSYVTQTSQNIAWKTAIGKRSGTTLALAVITKRGISCFNVSDSRIYFVKHGRFRQITHDHTVDNDLAYADASLKGRRTDGHKLTRCMGIGKLPDIEAYSSLPPNSRTLVCSDGLNKMISDKEIAHILISTKTPSEASDALLYAALNNGARDNVTVIVIDLYASGSWYIF